MAASPGDSPTPSLVNRMTSIGKPHPKAGSRSISLGDFAFAWLCKSAAMSIIGLAIALLLVLIDNSWLAIKTIGFAFFTTDNWDPVDEPNHRVFGSLAFIFGTCYTSLIAMAIAVPLGVGTAAFLSEIAPLRLRKIGSFFVEMLAAVPSVVYGFWGLTVLGPFLQKWIISIGGPNTGGLGIFPASIILAIMIVPYVSAITFDVLQAVPSSQRQGALALGATRWQMIRTVVVPYAGPGIIGGCFLALGRALGETMAVTMLIGNRPEISLSPFAMGNSIASVIANEIPAATYNLYFSALVELALVLLLVSALLSTAARILILQVQSGKKMKWPARLSFGSKKSVPAIFGDGTPQSNGQPHYSLKLPNSPRAQIVNRIMTGVLFLCLLVTVGFLFLIFGYLVYEGVGALNWDFFFHLPAPVGESGGGLGHAFYGSFQLVGLATLMATPAGLLAAIYLAEYRKGKLVSVVRFTGELLGSVPSIVIGIFAYSVAVHPSIGGKPLGFSGWAGSFALAVMMLPVVMRASEEALKLVPDTLRNASYALGASQWQTIVRISVPAALPAIITAIFLAIARVAGETAPLLLTAFGNQYMPSSPNEPTPSLPVYIFNYSKGDDAEWIRQAWAAALMLLIVVMLLNFGIRAATGKRLISASRSE